MLWGESNVPGCRIRSGPSQPARLAPEHFQHPVPNLSHSAAMLATKGLTHIPWEIKFPYGETQSVCGANFSRLKTLSQPSWLQHPCTPGELFPCPPRHVVLILLFPLASLKARDGAAASRQPARLVCRRLPAILSRVPKNVLLFDISIRCAWQPAPLPRHGGFPRWALQTTSVQGPGNLGLCRKEFAGQRVELSCATLFLSAVTLTGRQHPQGFGNSQSHWLAPLDAFSLSNSCSQPRAAWGADPAVWLSGTELVASAGLMVSPGRDEQRAECSGERISWQYGLRC